ncbi:MAG TPA: ATP-binding protein [Dissulfurispiraceae bacterium]
MGRRKIPGSSRKKVSPCSSTRGDIKRAASAAPGTRDFFFNLLHNFPNPIWIAGTDAGYVFLNKAWHEFIGRLEEDSTAEDWTSGVHSDDLENFTRAYLDAFARRETFVREYRIRDRAGDFRWFVDYGRPFYENEGEFGGYIGSCYDITEQKKMQAMIKKSYQTTRNILDNAPFGILLVNKDGSIEYANPSMVAISGSSYEIISRLNVYEIPSYVECGLSDHIKSAMEGRPFFIGDIHYTSHFAKKTTIRDITGIPLEQHGEQKVLMFVEDITDRKQAEQEHQKLQAQLLQSQKIESIGRLAGGIAHDFNNMLSAIIGYSDLALINLKPDNPALETFHTIKETGERAAELTRQLLAFSRKQNLRMEPVNLNAVITSMSKMLTRIIGEDISLELRTRSHANTIKADRSQIEQILLNLAVNARDAMPSGGSIVLETSDVEIGREHLRVRKEMQPGLYVMLSVSDTGVGMPKDVQERIFEPFFTTKELGKGTGLGLATTYGIVKQHSGFIYVYSEPGKGTTFKVYLPAFKGKEKTRQKEQETSMPCGRETVMIVDDDATVRKLMVDILEPLGYTIIEASNGREAEKIIGNFHGAIDILVTDVIMPEMNGKELAEIFQAKRPGKKVLFISGYTRDAISHQGMIDEKVLLLDKPITPHKLARKIREALDGKAPDSRWQS